MKEAVQCDQFRLWLARHFDELAPGGAWSRLEAHAASCPRCARMLEAERVLDAWLRARFTPPRLDEEFTRRLLDQVEPFAPAPALPSWIEWLEVAAGVSLAAALGLMLSPAPLAAVGQWLAAGAPHYAAWALTAALLGFGLWLAGEACSVRVDS